MYNLSTIRRKTVKLYKVEVLEDVSQKLLEISEESLEPFQKSVSGTVFV